MSLPADASLYQYPAYANARTYDAEFDRLTNLCWAAGEGLAPLDQTKDCTVTGMGTNKATDLEVLTNSSGLQVSVTAGQAWVQGDYRTTQGLYFCRVPTAQVVTLEAAHATLPRVDAIILKVYDADIPGDGTTQWTVTYAKGTATAGASLTNLTGAPAIPQTAMLLAYVLVPAAFAGPFVTATHISDRRFLSYRPGRVIGHLANTSSTATGVITHTSDSGRLVASALTIAGNGSNKVDLRSTLGYGISSASGTWAAEQRMWQTAIGGGGTLVGYGRHNATVNIYSPPVPLTAILDAFSGQRSYELAVRNESGSGANLNIVAFTQAPITLTARYR